MSVKIKFTQTQEQKNFEKAVDALDKNDKVAQIGWFPGALYDDGTPVAYVATIQEYGSVTDGRVIPPRPFMRPTLKANEGKYLGWIKNAIASILKGKSTIDQELDRIGQGVEGDIRKKIRTITDPPLAESTLKNRLYKKNKDRKRKIKALTITGAKPLVDTGKLKGSLTHRIGKK